MPVVIIPARKEIFCFSIKVSKKLIELASDKNEFRLKGPCVSTVENGNIWEFRAFRLPQELRCQMRVFTEYRI